MHLPVTLLACDVSLSFNLPTDYGSYERWTVQKPADPRQELVDLRQGPVDLRQGPVDLRQGPEFALPGMCRKIYISVFHV